MAKQASSTVTSAWQRLEAWCQERFPELLDNFYPGASVRSLRAFERFIGQPLPSDVRESYRIHNGQMEDGQPTGLIFGLPILPLVLVQREWLSWREFEYLNEEFQDSMQSVPEGAIQLDYTNRGWIPLTFDWSGNHIGVDLAPGPSGTVGQVITFGRDEHKKCVAAPSWSVFLNELADELQAGNFAIDKARQLRIKNPSVKHYHEAIAKKYRRTR